MQILKDDLVFLFNYVPPPPPPFFLRKRQIKAEIRQKFLKKVSKFREKKLVLLTGKNNKADDFKHLNACKWNNLTLTIRSITVCKNFQKIAEKE